MIMGLSGTLRRYRKQSKMTQQAVASSIGLQRSTYSRYEEGSNRPSWKVLIKLADLYGITIDELVGHITNPLQNDLNVCLNQRSAARVEQEIGGLGETAGSGGTGTVDVELLRRMIALFLSANSYAKETALLILENGQNKI